MHIHAESITKQFTEKFILREFSFQIAPGDKVNVAGKSGIGKTTLFRMLLGFEMPDAGRILINGKALEGNQIWQVRKEVAYVSQDLNIGLGTVGELFAETLSYKQNQVLKPAWQAKMEELMEYFELPLQLINSQLSELSGGEKQRIAIVNALLLQRKVYFLDEISSALDQGMKEKVLLYFLSKPEFTVLYISHDRFLPANTQVKTLQLNSYE
jgi:putative ABC transport system ATP-binding protein